MLDKMSLPPLPEFDAVLKGFNIKKNFQYLLYFAKNQQRMYSIFPEIPTSHLKQTDIPNGPDRDFILKHIGDILMMQESICTQTGKNEQKKVFELMIVSAQRFVMGLIMLGHVHIYEILIRELMPDFIKIIQRETYTDHYKSELHKKIVQFCKETITLLAMWFPKCFYDNTSSSWFKKAVLKYDISVKFIVYYTNEKIQQYQQAIMQLRLNQSKTECAECKYCQEMSGKNYNFLKSIPQIPSIIEEEEHQGSSIRYNKKKKNSQDNKKPSFRNSGSKSTSNYSNIPLESKIGGLQHDDQVSDLEEKSSSSKLSERIRKHRQARKEKEKKSMIRNSLKSRMEYFHEKSKISQQNGEDEKERKQYSTSSKNIYKGKENGILGDQIDSEDYENDKLKESLKGTLSEQYLGSVKNGYKKFKERQQNKYKFLNRGFGSSQSKREPSTEKVLPTYHSIKEDAYEISPSQQIRQQLNKHSSQYSATNYQKTRVFCISVFESEMYRTMQKTTRKLFRKQCFKLSKKKLVSSEPWILQIKCKPKGKKMQLKINLMSEYANTIEATLIQPKHSQILVKEGKNVYNFNFQRGFLPIAFRIGREQVLLPIALISMLEPVQRKDLWQEKYSEISQISNTSSYTINEIQFRLDTQLFKTVYHIAKELKFSQQQISIAMKRGSLCKKYLFFEEMILISIEEVQEDQGLVKIKIHHKDLKNDQKVGLILKEMKKCVSKSNLGARKVHKNEKKRSETLKSENNIIHF